jgi:hypothetical protein
MSSPTLAARWLQSLQTVADLTLLTVLETTEQRIYGRITGEWCYFAHSVEESSWRIIGMLSRNLPGMTEETQDTFRTTDVRTEIQFESLTDSNLETCCYANMRSGINNLVTQLTVYLQGAALSLKISLLLIKSRNFLLFLKPESHRPAHEIPRMIL